MTWLYALGALGTVAVILALVHRPLGDYMAWAYTAERDLRVERGLYRLFGVDPGREQTWKGYLGALLAFSFVGLVFLYGLQRLQPWLPYSFGLPAPSRSLAFNTAASFVAHTDWQAYTPETTFGFTVEFAGHGVQCFVSAAVSLAVAMALTRSFAARRSRVVGNFWVDVTRSIVRILLPLSIIAAIVLLATGVVENFTHFTDVTTLSGATQSIPGGPVASQEAIKQLGTNGGGFYAANSAHPFENPNTASNMAEILLLLLIPFSLPRTFGRIVGDRRFGYAIVGAMGVLFILSFVLMTLFELRAHGTAPSLAGAAMEGKEQRFGVVGSTLFGTSATGTSGGAANASYDSFTALGGFVLMLNMTMGEISPGGVGVGLYTILIMAIIVVFLTALLLGRPPVLLGKRIGIREMKLSSLFLFVAPAVALLGMGLTMSIGPIRDEVVNHAMANPGAHGISELLFAFLSASFNNGAAFAGFNADTTWLNITLGVVILISRFALIWVTLALAGSLARQDVAPTTRPELPLHRPSFVVLLIGVVALISVSTFFPALTLGPLAEGLT